VRRDRKIEAATAALRLAARCTCYVGSLPAAAAAEAAQLAGCLGIWRNFYKAFRSSCGRSGRINGRLARAVPSL
jgi:hypothetical protein